MRPEDRLHAPLSNTTPSAFSAIKDDIVEIVQGLSDLLRSEISLAKAEVHRQKDELTRAATFLGSAILLAFFAIGFILAACACALALAMPAWLAVLIVGVVVAAAAAVLYSMGRKRLAKLELTPKETIQSMKENVVWLKSRLT